MAGRHILPRKPSKPTDTNSDEISSVLMATFDECYSRCRRPYDSIRTTLSMTIADRLTPELRDAGKRAADIINEKLSEHGHDVIWHYCMAIRLSDGGSDGVLYENKRAAVAHQLHEHQCYYVFFRNIPAGARAEEMALMLLFQREAYDAGLRLVDPDDEFGGPAPLMTTNWHDSLTAAIRKANIR